MPIDKESPPSLSLKMMVLNAKRSHSDVDGQVKEMVSLVNLKKRFVMRFDVVKISYLGELGYAELVPEDERIFIPKEFAFFLRVTPEYFEKEREDNIMEDNNDGRINDLEANNDIDESDVEEVLETLFDQPDDQKDKHSDILLEGLNEGNTVNLDMKDYGENERDDNSFVNLEDGKDNSESVNKNSESKRSGHSKYSVLPRTGGSILNLMEEVVKGLYSPQEANRKRMLWDDLLMCRINGLGLTWNVAPVNKKNAIRNFMGKLKFLKDVFELAPSHSRIREVEIYFLNEYCVFDEVIDKKELLE
ncbi:hypothetical protein Tco_0705299 [Tanacetum coccineum]|uniref:Uncharacterized protein n=1 Tax=Tanacetum coccineum TaxID=301880 RepID=A0ABQ4Y5Q7_9ASTR